MYCRLYAQYTLHTVGFDELNTEHLLVHCAASSRLCYDLISISECNKNNCPMRCKHIQYTIYTLTQQFFGYFFFHLSHFILFAFRIFEIQFELVGFVKNFTNLFNSKQSFRNERFNNFSATFFCIYLFLFFILLYLFLFIRFSMAYRMVRKEKIETN